MQENSLIKNNILKYLDSIGISRYRFYKDTGITRGVLDGNNGMNEENTARFIVHYPEVNVEWLITGKGEMLKKEPKSSCQVIETEIVAREKDIKPLKKDDFTKYALEMIKDLSAENALLKAELSKYKNKNHPSILEK